jgi:hypothetical protein
MMKTERNAAPRIRLTKLEAEALRDAAGNMEDDFLDYFSYREDSKKYYAAFLSGMDKLSAIANRKPAKKQKP